MTLQDRGDITGIMNMVQATDSKREEEIFSNKQVRNMLYALSNHSKLYKHKQEQIAQIALTVYKKYQSIDERQAKEITAMKAKRFDELQRFKTKLKEQRSNRQVKEKTHESSARLDHHRKLARELIQRTTEEQDAAPPVIGATDTWPVEQRLMMKQLCMIQQQRRRQVNTSRPTTLERPDRVKHPSSYDYSDPTNFADVGERPELCPQEEVSVNVYTSLENHVDIPLAPVIHCLGRVGKLDDAVTLMNARKQVDFPLGFEDYEALATAATHALDYFLVLRVCQYIHRNYKTFSDTFYGNLTIALVRLNLSPPPLPAKQYRTRSYYSRILKVIHPPWVLQQLMRDRCEIDMYILNGLISRVPDKAGLIMKEEIPDIVTLTTILKRSNSLRVLTIVEEQIDVLQLKRDRTYRRVVVDVLIRHSQWRDLREYLEKQEEPILSEGVDRYILSLLSTAGPINHYKIFALQEGINRVQEPIPILSWLDAEQDSITYWSREPWNHTHDEQL